MKTNPYAKIIGALCLAEAQAERLEAQLEELRLERDALYVQRVRLEIAEAVLAEVAGD